MFHTSLFGVTVDDIMFQTDLQSSYQALSVEYLTRMGHVVREHDRKQRSERQQLRWAHNIKVDLGKKIISTGRKWSQKVAVKLLVFLLHIREVPSSDIPYWKQVILRRFLLHFLSKSKTLQRHYLKIGHRHLLSRLPNLSRIILEIFDAV
jgi:hypothetical protein